jgi:hypothetical protein
MNRVPTKGISGAWKQAKLRSSARFRKTLHFLDMPFYEGLHNQRQNLGPKDIELVRAIMEKVFFLMLMASLSMAESPAKVVFFSGGISFWLDIRNSAVRASEGGDRLQHALHLGLEDCD